MRRVIYILIMGLVVGCNDTTSSDVDNSKSATEASVNSVNINYKIIKDETMGSIKRSVEVLLPSRVDETTLKVLANSIYKDGFERTFISYRLEGEEKSGYWARINYDPELKILFIGAKKEAYEKLKSSEIKVSGEVSGEWLVNWGYEYKAVIYKTESQLMMRTLFIDGSSGDVQLFSHEINGQTQYYGENGKEYGEYYMINSNGDLQFWDEDGHYYTAPASLK